MKLNLELNTEDLKAVKSFLTRPVFLKDEYSYAKERLAVIESYKAGITFDEFMENDDERDWLDNFMYNYVSFHCYAELERAKEEGKEEVHYVTDYVQSILFFRAKYALYAGFSYECVAEWFKDVRLHIRKDVWLDLYSNFEGYITQSTI